MSNASAQNPESAAVPASSSCAVRRAPLTSIAAVFGCFALFVALVALAYLPKHEPSSTGSGAYEQDGIRTPAERLEKLAELRANEAAAINSYAWLDQSAGQVQLPIERAMELIVQRYSGEAAQR